MMKKMLALFLFLALASSIFIGVTSGAGGGPGDDFTLNEDYYTASTRMIQDHWRGDYFGKATLTVGSNVMQVDRRTVMLSQRVFTEGEELMLSDEILEALGIPVQAGPDSIVISKNGKHAELTYGDKTVKINGAKKGMPAAAALQNGKPVLPASVLKEDNLGLEIDYNEAEGIIEITNTFQMMRLIAKTEPGATLPSGLNAEEILAGPDNIYLLQFGDIDEAKMAFEILSGADGIVYVEPDMLVMLEEPVEYYDDPEVFTWDGDAEEQAAAGDFAAATYSHLGWGARRIGSDNYLDYLIAYGKQNNSVTVAVLDTGLDAAHPYFGGRHVPGNYFITSTTNDVNGHGTHVSGTIVDVTIALPNVKIMPVKVLGDTGSGATSGVANGIRWAADNGSNVINMSLGGGHSNLKDDAINYAVGKNVTVVVAAGNDAKDAGDYCPAHVGAAITVAAVDNTDKPAYFTNYGTVVDVAAPGVSVISTVPGNKTASYSGTSMASPHVAGAVAMLLVDNPSITPSVAKSVIRANVDPISTSSNNYYGSGILNIGKAAGEITSSFIVATPVSISENIYSGSKERQLSIAYYEDGLSMDVTSLATYESSNIAVASVSGSGLVTVIGAGQSIISVYYSGKTTTVPVIGESIQPSPTSVTVSPNTVTIKADAVQQLAAAVLPADANNTITWTSSNTNVATVSSSGLVTAKSAGTATITARTVNNLTATSLITVEALPPTSVTVTPNAATVNPNATRQLTVAVLPANANGAVTWASGNTAVATVSSSGLVTARAIGTTTITAKTVNGLTAECVITVPDTIAPVITLTGGSSITVDLGIAFVEPGYKAVDNVDGDITNLVVITGSVNTNVEGTYALTYRAADSSGNTGTATRSVKVEAPRASFSFSNSGKAGATFTNTFTAPFGGNATFTVSEMKNNTAATITVKDSSGETVLTNTYTANGSKSVRIASGSYTVTTKIDSANGNTTVGLSITVVGDNQPVPRTAPQISLIGSKEIVLHLGGSPYFEQGATATDSVDGNISYLVMIESNVDTSKAGNYTVKYSVTNSAGLTSSVTRQVSVIAPGAAAPGMTYSFSPKGKQGAVFTYSASVSGAGSVSLTVGIPNKTAATVKVTGSTGEVLNETFSANATRSFQAAPGDYTVSVTIDTANGNVSLELTLVTPGGGNSVFPRPEVPF